MRRFFAAVLFFAAFFSCKTPSFGAREEGLSPAIIEPAAAVTDAPAAEEKEPAAETVDAEEPAQEEELPSAEDFPEAPLEEPPEPPAPEPPPVEPEFPRVITFLDPPPEEVTDRDYPEPEPPALPPLPELAQTPEESPAPSAPELEPEPVGEPASVPGTAPLPEPAPLPEEPPALPPAPPSPPAPPPPIIRPAESAGVRPAPREALPVPVNPPPDPPARQPPVTVRPAPPNPPPVQDPAPAAPGQTESAISPLPAPSGTEDAVSYSRTIHGTTGQILEAPFRGTGWVYLGEANAERGISYLSRRTDPEGQSFIFRLDESGEYELKFYKQDFIRDYILNDHVRVIVEDASGRNSFFYPDDPVRLIAEPRWPPPENPVGRTDSDKISPSQNPRDEQSPGTAATGTAAAGQGGVVPEASAAETAVEKGEAPENAAELLPSALLRRAREAYEAGRFSDALAALDEFRLNFPLGSDEAWWLYGQLLESAGPRRDIRGALEYYRRLVREYPQSPRCDDARQRIAYLERFYFNIR